MVRNYQFGLRFLQKQFTWYVYVVFFGGASLSVSPKKVKKSHMRFDSRKGHTGPILCFQAVKCVIDTLYIDILTFGYIYVEVLPFL